MKKSKTIHQRNSRNCRNPSATNSGCKGLNGAEAGGRLLPLVEAQASYTVRIEANWSPARARTRRKGRQCPRVKREAALTTGWSAGENESDKAGAVALLTPLAGLRR
ncbi:MAG TPA: hypothetical protein VG146_17800 [Verrucomicrobiae bacterium]|nr:hypothetical protein [Verrucomicrobiae bacterium]